MSGSYFYQAKRRYSVSSGADCMDFLARGTLSEYAASFFSALTSRVSTRCYSRQSLSY